MGPRTVLNLQYLKEEAGGQEIWWPGCWGRCMSPNSGLCTCSAASIEWFAEEGRRICGDLLESTNKDLRMVTTKQPVGVVSAICPWNFPFRSIELDRTHSHCVQFGGLKCNVGKTSAWLLFAQRLCTMSDAQKHDQLSPDKTSMPLSVSRHYADKSRHTHGEQRELSLVKMLD